MVLSCLHLKYVSKETACSDKAHKVYGNKGLLMENTPWKLWFQVGVLKIVGVLNLAVCKPIS